ncbi:peptidase M16 [Alkalilimnicola ehrlichii]|uniref:Peptidase M16 n=1 Tax=Alkalilimnicola ehrlichii TaxID=351052 RepID=A0A3E0WZS2_9GAMM|nr:pitrilysin family protein [Alkalilimnicola ehrlichii]RFA30056.1 peptidase M16 [Alkalilimnicola ehrlichii]RFA37397.1 peptidase M16 [Alkalilimnicola ehrlichii]
MRPFLRTLSILWLVLWLPLAQANSPEIRHWQLDNGARVYFVQTETLPIVDLRVTFDAGAARDGEQAGLARLTNSLLSQGAAGLNADELALAFESVGARYSSGSERDMAWLQLRSLTRPEALTAATDTLAMILAAPEFPEADLERQRRQMLVALQAERQSPPTIAERALYEALYGDHPYASAPQGTEDSVRALSREAVVEFHEQYYTAGNAVLAIVGDLSANEARELSERLLADLPAGDRAPQLPEPEPPEPQTVHIPYPSAQTHVLIGQLGIARGDEDYFPLYVGNHILGGSGLVSMLVHEMRERRGLSYSSYSYFVPSAERGPFILGTQVRADRTGEALEVLENLFVEFRAEGPSADRLQAAQENITGSFPLNIDSNRKIVGYVSMIGFYGLPLDHLDTFIGQVEAVTQAAIVSSFQNRLDPEHRVRILVGPEGILADEDE